MNGSYDRMVKKFSNLKIVHAFFLILLVGALSFIAIGVVSFADMRLLDKNTNIMYDDNLIPISQAGEIRKNLLFLRLDVTKAVYEEKKDEYISDIETIDATIRKTMKDFSVHQSGNEEKKLISSFNTNYEKYMETWRNIKERLLKNEEIEASVMNEYKILGNNLVATLDELIKHKKMEADSLKEASNKTYISAIRILLGIFIAVILIFSALSLASVNIIRKALKQITADLERISQGDFTVIMDLTSKNEFGIMKKSLSSTIENISKMLISIKAAIKTMGHQSENLSAISEEMAASSQEVANATQEISSGAMSQASVLSGINDTIISFGRDLDGITKAITDVDSKAQKINSMAVNNDKKLQDLINSIYAISTSFNSVSTKISDLGKNITKINEITVLINSIADQTNLLALNAAIEAARAGESGRGFAVVADEIRKLAEQSKTSSENINSLLKNVLSESSAVVGTTDSVNKELNSQIVVINNSIESFKDINNAIGDILPKIDNINKSAVKINKEKNSIVTKIEVSATVAERTSASSEEIAASTQEMNASSEQVASTAQELTQVSREIIAQVDKFKL
jgi:methyl-accepting chemotaxis protein